jgi:hypothetical protein
MLMEMYSFGDKFHSYLESIKKDMCSPQIEESTMIHLSSKSGEFNFVPIRTKLTILLKILRGNMTLSDVMIHLWI